MGKELGWEKWDEVRSLSPDKDWTQERNLKDWMKEKCKRKGQDVYLDTASYQASGLNL